MSDNISTLGHDYGPLRTYQLTWKSGHVERVQGHQVMMDGWQGSILNPNPEPKFYIHGQFGRHWRLVLAGNENELESLRDVTEDETISS